MTFEELTIIFFVTMGLVIGGIPLFGIWAERQSNKADKSKEAKA